MERILPAQSTASFIVYKWRGSSRHNPQHLLSFTESVFEINEESGDVTTKLGASPDYEVMATYDVEVVARDGGNPSLSVSILLHLNSLCERNNGKHVKLVGFAVDSYQC